MLLEQLAFMPTHSLPLSTSSSSTISGRGDIPIGDLAKDDVLSVQPAGDNSGDEELRAVCVGAGVGHGEQAGLGVLELEVLVLELLAVDGLATGAVATGEVTSLVIL